MEIILLKDVQKIGKAGSVIKAKDGFARNYLIPQGLAVIATPAGMKKLKEEQERRSLELENKKQEARVLKERLEKLSLTIAAMVGTEENLYGSITVLDIAQALKDEGLDIDKSSIIMESPIKSLGIYEIPVKLDPDVLAQVKVWIVKK
ncbi:MAG: 50S ribosomal protein L9 [Candidatus Omnitrophica bacterium]|nr:50S ribosomal protein L9 [Candidatus Omnitrophota bacterium]